MHNPWELYESDSRFREAHHALEMAWEQAKHMKTIHESRTYMEKIMAAYSAQGANDSEPRWHLEDKLRKLETIRKLEQEI